MKTLTLAALFVVAAAFGITAIATQHSVAESNSLPPTPNGVTQFATPTPLPPLTDEQESARAAAEQKIYDLYNGIGTLQEYRSLYAAFLNTEPWDYRNAHRVPKELLVYALFLYDADQGDVVEAARIFIEQTGGTLPTPTPTTPPVPMCSTGSELFSVEAAVQSYGTTAILRDPATNTWLGMLRNAGLPTGAAVRVLVCEP